MTSDFAPVRENSPAPRLTLIVATLGRTDEVAALLHSIPRAARELVEVVVIDGNATPLTNVLEPFTRTLALVHVRTFLRNASAARNLGAATAKAAWLMFPDDDARFASGALESLLGTIGTDTLDLVSGSIVDDEGKPHLLPWPAAPSPITSKTLDCTLVESSFAIRKTIFDAIGGFDPKFGPGGCFHSAEGADLVRRLWQRRPVRALYTPAIRLHHPLKPNDASPAGLARTFNFAVGEGAFTARHHRQLKRLTIGRKLLFRAAGIFISSGGRRQRKIAFLRGFFKGVLSYRRFHTP
ncbi:MAG: glycosyltransferase family 2 protein [Janthinobacterium lividum]